MISVGSASETRTNCPCSHGRGSWDCGGDRRQAQPFSARAQAARGGGWGGTVDLEETIPGSEVTLETCQALREGLLRRRVREGVPRLRDIEIKAQWTAGEAVGGGWGGGKHSVTEGSPHRDPEVGMSMPGSRAGEDQCSQRAEGGAEGGGRASCELHLKGRQGLDHARLFCSPWKDGGSLWG